MVSKHISNTLLWRGIGGENFIVAKLSILALDTSLPIGLVVPRGKEKILKGVHICGIKLLMLKEIREMNF